MDLVFHRIPMNGCSVIQIVFPGSTNCLSSFRVFLGSAHSDNRLKAFQHDIYLFLRDSPCLRCGCLFSAPFSPFAESSNHVQLSSCLIRNFNLNLKRDYFFEHVLILISSFRIMRTPWLLRFESCSSSIHGVLA